MHGSEGGQVHVWTRTALGCDNSSRHAAFGVNWLSLSLLWLWGEMHSGTKHWQSVENEKDLQVLSLKAEFPGVVELMG